MENLKDGYISDYVSGLQVRITPEEIEAVQPFLHKLVDDYGYPKENIVTHPQYRVKARPSDVKKEYPVDIAVFADSKHKDDDCYLIVECKKKKRRDGKEQLEDYLRFSKASLGVWYNGKETLYLRKYEQGGYVKFIEIPNIPIYGQRVEDVGLFRRCDLKKTHNLWLLQNGVDMILEDWQYHMTIYLQYKKGLKSLRQESNWSTTIWALQLNTHKL